MQLIEAGSTTPTRGNGKKTDAEEMVLLFENIH